MKPPKPFYGPVYQDGGSNTNVSLRYFAWTFGSNFQRLLEILTVITYLLYIWLSHLKQLI